MIDEQNEVPITNFKKQLFHHAKHLRQTLLGYRMKTKDLNKQRNLTK
jgi:hypothetical protein